MEDTEVATTVRVLPGIMAIVVALGLAYALTASRFGSQRPSTVVLAAAIVGVAAAGAWSVATGREDLAAGIALLVLAGGFVGFALGPQLWIVGLLLLLSTELDRPIVPFVLLGFIAPLLVLTVVTSPGREVVVTGLAVAVFVVAAASTFATRLPRWRARQPSP